MSSSEYKILLGEDQESEADFLSSSSEKPRSPMRATIWGLVVFLFASLSFNVMWIFQTIYTRNLSISDISAEYSNLSLQAPVDLGIGGGINASVDARIDWVFARGYR